MIRKIILFITSLIICLPLYANPEFSVMIKTDIEGQLTMKKYYSSISEDNDITNGTFYIDQDGVNTSLANVDNPFNIREGYISDNFIITFFGSVEIDQVFQIDATISNYYYLDNSEKTYINLSPNIINKTPENGQLTFLSGIFYEINNSNLNEYTFKIESLEYNTLPANRYFTDITINVTEN